MQIVEVKPKGKMLFEDYLTSYIEDMELGRRTKKGRTVKVSPSYIKCLRIILGQIRNYQKETHRKLGLDDMTMETRNSLVGYWKERGLMPNAINSYMTDVRTVARAAYEDKFTKCDDFRHSDFVPKKEDVDNIYLTPEQIQEMLDLDLSTKEAVKERLEALEIREDEKLAQLSKCRITHIRTLEHVRDIFIVGCLTGQRVSDYSRICEDMITEIGGTEFILLTQQKTEKKVYIPVDRRVRAILTKYNGTLPHVGPNEMNKLVKTIGLLLGWTHDCGFDEKRLNPKRGRRFCDMLLSHTARRSFATNAYKAGVPLSSIQAITGHSSEAQLRRYLKLDAEEKSRYSIKGISRVLLKYKEVVMEKSRFDIISDLFKLSHMISDNLKLVESLADNGCETKMEICRNIKYNLKTMPILLDSIRKYIAEHEDKELARKFVGLYADTKRLHDLCSKHADLNKAAFRTGMVYMSMEVIGQYFFPETKPQK